MQSSGGQVASSVIPSGINGDPNYNNAKYVYYSGNANPLWRLSGGLSLKNLYFLDFSLIFKRFCNAFVCGCIAFRREYDWTQTDKGEPGI